MQNEVCWHNTKSFFERLLTAAQNMLGSGMRLSELRLRTTAIDADLAGHAHKLDLKLQSLCGSGLSLLAVRMLAKRYHFGVN